MIALPFVDASVAVDRREHDPALIYGWANPHAGALGLTFSSRL